MVLVDGVKYACQACIKGHRSSKCTHTERELTEIKKKGRPTSQCTHCRELRKTRSVHGKCDCVGSKTAQDSRSSAKILPNGLIDILKPAESTSESPNESVKSRVTLLLNSCNCRSGGPCTCCQTVSKAKTKPFPESPPIVSPVLPTPPADTVSNSTGGCCSSNRPAQSLPLPEPPIAKSSCCSSRSVPSPSYSNLNDIEVSPTLPTPPPYTSASNPLFLPQTHGTLSCFCGPTCQCVGCATHDPFALKAKRKRSNSMELEEEPLGCKCEVSPGENESEIRRKGKKKKECCSSSRMTTPPSAETGSEIEWPELNLYTSGGGGGRVDSTSNDPLPSLRTLLPALIDSTSHNPPFLPRPRFDGFDPPSYISDSPNPQEEPKIVCSSAFVKEIFDGNGDCGSKCLCETDCGCRDDGEAAREESSQIKKVKELGDVARLAEMGLFG